MDRGIVWHIINSLLWRAREQSCQMYLSISVVVYLSGILVIFIDYFMVSIITLEFISNLFYVFTFY